MSLLATAEPGPLDRALQLGLPVVGMPLQGSFVPLTEGRRLLVGKDGLYIEAASPALYVRLRVAEAFSPYGAVSETLVLRHGPIARSIAAEIAHAARAAHPMEMAALIVAEAGASGGYRLIRPDASSSPGSVTYDDGGYDDALLVIDAHSHGAHDAFFSATDDVSDLSRMGPHISVVFGHCGPRDQLTVVARVCIGHYLIPIPADSLEGCFA
jgi:PRTRC genetic system protein A